MDTYTLTNSSLSPGGLPRMNTMLFALANIWMVRRRLLAAG
jgi:hypothetical protein